MVRQSSLDIFRLIAAFAVVILHVSMGIMPLEITIYARLICRFAVPFFFLVSGYFFYLGFNKAGDAFFLKNITKLASIFVVSSLVFLPIDIAKGTFVFNEQLILTGTGSHLWFIPSLMFGLLFLWYFSSVVKKYWILPLIAVVSVLPFVVFYYSVGNKIHSFINIDFARFVVSIPFLSIGAFFAHYKIKPSLKIGLILIACSVILLFLEVNYFQIEDPINLWSFQFLVNTVPLSIGIFFISFDSLNNSHLAALGRKYSLGIYLYHPFVNMVIYNLIRLTFGNLSEYVLLLNPVLCFTLTMSILIFLDNRAPRIFRILNGDFLEAKA
jgi:surface polysaccharide O-acyltransferase-like enzyme